MEEATVQTTQLSIFAGLGVLSLAILIIGIISPKVSLFYLPIKKSKKTRLLSYTIYFLIMAICLLFNTKDAGQFPYALISLGLMYLLGLGVVFIVDKIVKKICKVSSTTTGKEENCITDTVKQPESTTSQSNSPDRQSEPDHQSESDNQFKSKDNQQSEHKTDAEFKEQPSEKNDIKQNTANNVSKVRIPSIFGFFRERKNERAAVELAFTSSPENAYFAINNLPQVVSKRKSPADVIIRNINYVMRKILQNSYLTKEMEDNLEALNRKYELPSSAFDKDTALLIVKARLTRDLLEGNKNPIIHSNPTPIMLQKNEVIIFYWDGIRVDTQERIREYQGGSRGVSIRLAKGLYYRTGGMRGHSVSRNVSASLGKGIIVVTNKAVYICCGGEVKKLKLENLIMVNPYSNALDIKADGAYSKPFTLWTRDAAFMATCIRNAQNWE